MKALTCFVAMSCVILLCILEANLFFYSKSLRQANLENSRCKSEFSGSKVVQVSLKLLNASGFPRRWCRCEDEISSTKEIGPLVGFYHVFESDAELFQRVMAEQTNFIAESSLAGVPVQVTYVGPNPQSFDVENFTVVQAISAGTEKFSLKLLFDHCSAHLNNSVFYIHSKGTFHPSDANDLLRRNLMKGVLACIEQHALSSSDVCGLRASPLPHPHISGNMWVARCDYVVKLKDPLTFESEMDRATANKAQSCSSPWLGRERFSDEHWILSHPSVVVSDALPAATGPQVYAWGYDYLPDPTSWTPQLKTFPRSDIPVCWYFLGSHFAFVDLHCSLESHRIAEYLALFGTDVMADLPYRSMYCQWFPLAFVQLSFSHIPDHAAGPVRLFLSEKIQ